MWAIALTWVTLFLPPVIGDGRYESHASCESFIKFALNDAPYEYTEGKFIIEEYDGNIFIAECVKVDEDK